jgi:hypothetical protein
MASWWAFKRFLLMTMLVLLALLLGLNLLYGKSANSAKSVSSVNSTSMWRRKLPILYLPCSLAEHTEGFFGAFQRPLSNANSCRSLDTRFGWAPSQTQIAAEPLPQLSPAFPNR